MTQHGLARQTQAHDSEIPDEELAARTLAGDTAAFGDLVGRHQDVVLRVAARIVGQEESQDVAQDTFLRAFHRLDRFSKTPTPDP
jgi:RNA polymerase sigma-70 factor (ECF subfamily)